MEDRDNRLGVLLTAVLAVGFVVSLVLTVVAYREQAVREARHELARLGLEDVARRVERNTRNLKSIRALSDGNALTKTRAFAQLLASDPSVLKRENRPRFDALAKLLDVDELHVVDAKGVLVRCFPAVYEGQNMSGSAQSAAFLPALTNAAFELVQEPQGKGLATGDEGLDQKIFQYAGVARRDAPGLVQVGYRPQRVAEAMKLADVDEIVQTTRIGRQGRVRIERLRPGEMRSGGQHVERAADGSALLVFETTCAGYAVAVLMPERLTFLSGESAVGLLTVVDLILLLLLAFAFPAVRGALRRDVRELCRLLTTQVSAETALWRRIVSPLSIASVCVYAVVVVVLAVLFYRGARLAAQESLHAAVEDIVSDMDDCVDAQLAFIGHEICLAYGTPEAMKDLDVTALMKTYFVDELNIVDGDGRCLNSTVPAIRGNNQWKKRNPAKFCQALLKDGAEVYSQPFRQSATESHVYRKYVGVAFSAPAKGYIQIGFDRIRLQSSIDYRLRGLACNWHIGETGFFLISKTSNGEVLSCDREQYIGQTLAGIGFDLFAARTWQNSEKRDPESRQLLGFESVNYFVSKINDEPCLCTSGVVNQFHRYVAAMPLSEVYGGAWWGTLLTAGVLLLAMVVIVTFLSRQSDLVANLKGFIAKDKAQREKDLTLAKTIQMSALPIVFPDTPAYRIFARMDTAREVGGDFYDFFTLPDGKIVFLVADVSGKGIPAALFMMRAKALVRGAALRAGGGELAAVVAEANDALAESNEAEMFVTAWIGTFDPGTGEVTYVNAGHNAPLVKRADGSVEWLRARSGLVLAAMGGAKYRPQAMKLGPGDSLLLYTDGVTEAMNGTGELYGEERLERTLKSAGPEFVTAIRHDVALFVGVTEQSDDITMLALDFK